MKIPAKMWEWLKSCKTKKYVSLLKQSRETIEFLKEKIFKKISALDQELKLKKINADRDVMRFGFLLIMADSLFLC